MRTRKALSWIALAAITHGAVVGCQAPASGPIERGSFATVEIRLES